MKFRCNEIKPLPRTQDVIKFFPVVPVIATSENKKYKVIITEIPPWLASNNMQKGLVYFQRKKDNLVVWCGCWMDWTETHWQIPDEKYYLLPRHERAQMEANEQLEHWVDHEFKRLINRDD